jgi:hypothetical protein
MILKNNLFPWRKYWHKNLDWLHTLDYYGLHLRIFADAEEEQLLAKIWNEYVNNDLHYFDQDFRLDCLSFHIEKLRATRINSKSTHSNA